MPPARRVLFVHAHPDDETLATGGAIARYAADPGTEVTVVTCTLGEEGEIIPAELAELAPGRADQLGGYRSHELAAALAALGGPRRRQLGGLGRWRDSGMAPAGQGTLATALPSLHPRAFAAPEAFAAQLEQLLELVDEAAPQVVVSYAEDGGYGHPDHVRAHLLATAAAEARPQTVRRVFYSVRSHSVLEQGLAAIAGLAGMPFRLPEPGELPSVPDADVTTRLDVSAHRAARIAALRAHATQIAVWGSVDPAGPVAYALSNGIAHGLADVEEYVLAAGPGPAPADFFEGLA